VADREKFYNALSQGNVDEVKQLTQEALKVVSQQKRILKEDSFKPWIGSGEIQN
jgi:poly-D-alanine transfer protein DltD